MHHDVSVVDGMNPGYLSYVLFCIAAILCASGWKESFISGFSYRAALFFFIGWLSLSGWSIKGGFLGEIRLNMAAGLMAICAAGALQLTRGWLQRLHLMSVGLLIASLDYLLHYFMKLNPMLTWMHSDLATALLVAMIAVAALRTPVELIGALSIGLLVSEIMFMYVTHHWISYEIAGRTFQDRWWLTVFAALSFSWLYRSCSPVLKSILDRLGVLRKKEEE
jgi:hypothetical protein